MMSKLRLALLISMLPPPTLAAEPLSPQIAAVSKLYQAFAYEAVLDSPSAPVFVDQPKEVLLRYVTPKLYELIHRDRVCTMTRHEICRLDFGPLWGNQDPSGTTVQFEVGASNNTVVAHLRIGSNSTRLTYSLVRTAVGWRVDDIAYDDGRPTLREILERNLNNG